MDMIPNKDKLLYGLLGDRIDSKGMTDTILFIRKHLNLNGSEAINIQYDRLGRVAGIEIVNESATDELMRDDLNDWGELEEGEEDMEDIFVEKEEEEGGVVPNFIASQNTVPDKEPVDVVRRVPAKLDMRPEEVESALEKPELREMVSCSEVYLQRPLSATDVKSLAYIYARLGFNVKMLDLLLQYCAIRSRQINVNYVEAIARNWYERGIDSEEKVREEIQNRK